MITTILLVLSLFLATLVSTSFHFLNLGVLLLLLVLIFYHKNTFILVGFGAVALSLFGHVDLGLSLLMVGVLAYLVNFSRENFFSTHHGASIVVALVLLFVWDMVFAVII